MFTSQIISIGNAIVDILAYVDNNFLERYQLTKSTMKLCTHEEQDMLLSDLDIHTSTAGGSAANTTASLAAMGLSTGFIGSIGDDEWGQKFLNSLQQSGVHVFLETVDDAATGTSVIVITPDSERTMNTHLGASAKISHQTLSQIPLDKVPYIFVEGYAFDSPETRSAVETVISSSPNTQKIVMTLSDAGCVKRHRDDIAQLISSVDILLGNENEYRELFQISEELTDDLIYKHIHLCSNITVITQSEKGCLLIQNNSITAYQAIEPRQLLDLTGAGDQFAAGFLFGIASGLSLDKSIICATSLASEVISQIGPRLPIQTLEMISRQFSST